MFENSKWIGLKKGEDSLFKTEKYTSEKENSLKEVIEPEKGSLLFRYSFNISEKPIKAKLAICGLGFYDVYINGRKPDENRVLTPCVSDYFLLSRYDVYDILPMLNKENNTICAEVGPGWFSPSQKYWGWRQTWYGNPRLIAEIEIFYADGSSEKIVSDKKWKITRGAVTESNIYDGESYDFNLEKKNWTDFEYDDSEWNNAVEVNAPSDKLEESDFEPERIVRVLKPINTHKLSDTVYCYDFGENGAGMPAVTVKGKKGSVVKLEHAEYINGDFTLNRASENNALCTDTFILSGDDPALCTIRFVWHGYRYMTVNLSDPDIKIISVEKRVVHTDVVTIGDFKCGDEEINNLHSVYVRTMLSCLQGIPIDCPQRDERKSWLGDSHVSSEMCLYNFDMRKLFASYLEDMNLSRLSDSKCVSFITPCYNTETTVVDGQKTSIDWNMAYPIILNEYYEHYGDTAILRACLESYKKRKKREKH